MRIAAAVLAATLVFGSTPVDATPVQMVGRPWHPSGRCPEYYFLALYAGWSRDDWPTLDRIIWRESRCQPDACSTPDRPDLRLCRDWGLTQINDHSWKTTIRQLGLDMAQMHDPYWNLWFARWLYNYSMDRTDGNCGWIQWSINCK